MAVAGKVAITLSTENGGAWSADVTYDRLVAVKHNNNLYISRKTVANVEPPNDEFWFLALEGFSGDDVEDIINGTTQVGNAKTLDGHGAEYFAPKTDLANYLPKSGDVSLNGLFDIQGRYTVIDPLRITSNHPTDERNLIEFKLRDTVQGYLGFKDMHNPVFMHAGGGVCYPLLHTGNKPTGTYTGNGDATERIIATNGIGNAVMVFGQNGTMAIVSARGVICADETGVRFFGRTNGAYKLAEGNIYMNSADKALNEMGITYQWQEL